MTAARLLQITFYLTLNACGLASAAPPTPETKPTQSVVIAYRSTVLLPDQTTDQNHKPFTVSGLSGITHLQDDRYLAVMDNSDKVVKLRVTLSPRGRIESAAFPGGLTVAENRDFEGIAFTGAKRNSVLLAYEGKSVAPQARNADECPGVREYNLGDGTLMQALPTPAIFANRRPNLGFESLARSADGRDLWTGNEEALTIDGPASSVAATNVVRLIHYIVKDENYTPAEQYAYEVNPWHKDTSGRHSSRNQSGLSDLVWLPNGKLLALERSFVYNGVFSSFQTRIYILDFAPATDVSGMTGGLKGQTYRPVHKELAWSGSLVNLEGLCVGPRLANGFWPLIGVTDNNGVLPQTLVSFEMACD